MSASKRSFPLETFVHYLTGAILLLKGVDKAEHFSEHPGPPLLLFLCGATVFALTIFHHQVERKLRPLSSYIHLVEFVGLLAVTYYYFVLNKMGISACYFVGAIGNLVTAIIHFVRFERKNRVIATK